MHRIFMLFVVILALCAGTALSQDAIPDLTGTWNVAASAFHVKGKGLIDEGVIGVWKFEEQKGRIFHGVVEWDVKGKAHKGSDAFSGVIAKDDKTVYIAGHSEGLRIGSIDGPDSITMYFIVPGGPQPRAGFAELTRAK